MYAFCVICSGVMIRFLYPDYQERPLKMNIDKKGNVNCSFITE